MRHNRVATVLFAVAVAVLAAGAPSSAAVDKLADQGCGLTQSPRTGDLTTRSVWLSVFDSTTGDNAGCSLGATGEIMATVLLEETGSACATAPQLAILGPKSYYRLELSADGTVVRRLNAGCLEHTCSDCKYDKTLLSMDECMAETGNNGQKFSFALVQHSDSAPPCIGPYTVGNMSSVTAVANIDVSALQPGFLHQHPDALTGVCDQQQGNCSAALFALTLSDSPSECVAGHVFRGLLNFAYSISQSDGAYTMHFCNNQTHCTSNCATLFQDLPLNVCESTMLGDFNARVELMSTSTLPTCRNKTTWRLSWVLGAVGGAIAAAFFVILAVFQYRRRQQRRARYAVAADASASPSKDRAPRSRSGYGAIN